MSIFPFLISMKNSPLLAIRDFKPGSGAKCAGVHLEGPFLSYAMSPSTKDLPMSIFPFLISMKNSPLLEVHDWSFPHRRF